MYSINEIKAFMRKNKITYEELARRCGGSISISTIKDIMRGKTTDPRIGTVLMIENVLGLSSDSNIPQYANIRPLTELPFSELFSLIQQLPPHKQELVLAYIKGLLAN